MNPEQIQSHLGRNFQPGFRMSPIDVFVLGAGVVGTIVLSSFLSWIGLLVAFVVGHFFLFCNVLRVPRVLELAWAGILWRWPRDLLWRQYLAGRSRLRFRWAPRSSWLPLPCANRSYHGVGWQRINPNLRQWWAANGGDTHRSGSPEE